jgi:hypothetical protein
VPKNIIDIEGFVQAWVAENVHLVVGPGSVPSEMDRLAADITRAARARGISGRELNRTVGDIDDYLTKQYQRVCAGQQAEKFP